MSYDHSFVVAKFAPKKSASWTSYYGVRAAALLSTRPFLALRMPLVHIGLQEPSDPPCYVLFLVSGRKPEGLNDNSYFALGPASDQESKILHVRPGPLLCPDGRTLYVHTFPKLFEDELVPEPVPVAAEFSHHLDNSDFLTFCRSVLEQPGRIQANTNARYSGGEDSVPVDWDSWSGQSPREGLNERFGYVFEYLRAETFDFSSLESPSIYEELLLYKQLTAEYSWSGVTEAVSWACRIRKFPCAPQRTLAPPFTFTGKIPTVSSDLMAAAFLLNSMKIPFDGDPVPAADEEPEIEWDDGPDSSFPFPRHKAATPPSHIKVVAFDLLDTIFDRNTPIVDALRLLAPSLDKRRLLEVFVECEGLRHRDHPHVPHIRGTLGDVCARLGVDCSNSMLGDALHAILRPGLHAEAEEAVKMLSDRGYTLLALPLPDADSFSSSLPPLPCGITLPAEPLWTNTSGSRWFTQTPHIVFSELLERAREKHPDVDGSQILVVTSGPYRVAEPANAAGFPVALIRRPGSLEPQVDVGTYDPTLVATGLRDLCAQLEPTRGPIQPTPPVKRPFPRMRPFRVCDLYQATRVLGSGSFGNIYGAFHVLTGEEVALKVEMPTGKPDETCVLPYEAQVYRLLRGHTGIPFLRWSGMDGGAHVLILDKLGVNLQQLRRLCRGTLSLRSVCALALQMLDRIEFAHSRGVVIRDIKPENFAMGVGARAGAVHLFDLGLAKLFVDPRTGQHIPPREGRVGLGTPRYASYNVHFGREQSRRDDLEALGNVLLFLLHGRLPWQGIYAPSIEAKLLRIGEMKAGAPFRELLARSPPEFTRYFEHVRGLGFEDKPGYTLLVRIFRERMEREGWAEDGGCFDWVGGAVSPNLKGTLVPDEYKWGRRVHVGGLGHSR
ncbi:kinase-like domain-containing protein [Hygrophoropsis aurantiaca]|uniref:Kinase-like domain-containing protein n=1 Tax=Hygrophoropsis aurantiaca TaxID=72124 RepID=A0ACB8A4A1_9AGAM|nr:kinase-like domain-containing protein [Hygrophoropsis aurantiaca]